MIDHKSLKKGVNYGDSRLSDNHASVIEVRG